MSTHSSNAPTLFEAVRDFAQRTPEHLALRGPGQSLSYRTLDSRSRALAAQLAAHGIVAGDIVALQLPNSPEFVLALLAVTSLGAAVQMIHMPYRQSELRFLLNHSGAKAYIGLAHFRDESPAQMAVLVQAEQRANDAIQAISLQLLVSVGGPVAGTVSWQTLLDTADADAIPETSSVPPDTHYVLLYTSGTTADPKGVPIEHHRFIGNARASIAPLHITHNDVLLSCAPFSHLYGLFVLELALLAGASVSLLSAYTPPSLVETVLRDKVSAIFAGPAHFKPLLDQSAICAMRAADFASVRFVCLSGTAVAPELALQVESNLSDGVVIQLWGMSELQAGSYGRPNDPAHVRLETAGVASPGTELRIVDDAGQTLTANSEGRLQVRGPSLFSGYLRNPSASASAFTEGWFDTGDLAKLTTEHALVITGRVKELINRGGVKFNPIDVEAILDQIAGVERCVLVPVPDPVLGERTCAVVKTNGQASVSLTSLTQALAKAGVAKFKWPERLIFVDSFPLTPTQKVMRAKLREQIDPAERNT